MTPRPFVCLFWSKPRFIHLWKRMFSSWNLIILLLKYKYMAFICFQHHWLLGLVLLNLDMQFALVNSITYCTEVKQVVASMWKCWLWRTEETPDSPVTRPGREIEPSPSWLCFSMWKGIPHSPFCQRESVTMCIPFLFQSTSRAVLQLMSFTLR